MSAMQDEKRMVILGDRKSGRDDERLLHRASCSMWRVEQTTDGCGRVVCDVHSVFISG